MITIKTKEEIAILREGGARHALILQELARMVAPGVSTVDLEAKARSLIGSDKAAFMGYRPGGAKRPYPAALCVCINDEVVHGIPNENPRVIAAGDIVTIDFGLVHGRLFTDAAVSVVVPDPNSSENFKERLELLQIANVALAAGIKAAKGGKRVGDISAAIERAVRGTKANIIKELCGHGLGYSVHEDPFVPNFGQPGTGELLKPGMILAIEPILTLGTPDIVLQDDGYLYKTADGASSVQVEHTILITKGDAEVLTAFK